MKNMYFLVFIVMNLFASNVVFACRCEIPDIESAYRQSSMVVFANTQDVIIAPSGEGSTAVLIIDRWWKSKSPKKIIVNSLSNCSYPLEAGKNYLLFLDLESNGLYSTGQCAGNKALEFNSKYKEKLLKLKQSSKNSNN